MVSAIATVAVILFVITAGLTAGLFWAYSYSVMRALASVDDRVFVTVMNKISVAILNPWFGFCFGGGAVFGLAAVILIAVAGGAGLLPAIVALAGYLIAVMITSVVNVPLNNALATIDPEDADPTVLATGRSAFESRWVRANHLRAAVHTIAFAAGCWMLLAVAA